MLTGRIIVNKLVNDRLMFYQTEGAEKLLNQTNMAVVCNLSKERGPGAYFLKHPDDMAFTYTVITANFDSSGRYVGENDTVILKFNGEDGGKLLNVLEDHFHYSERMKRVSQVHEVLSNPLPEVIL